MSTALGPDLGTPRRRADAQRSIDAIVVAARSVLGERPDASMEDIAAAAGLTRQTVYAHFPSRDDLILAIFRSVRAQGLATLEGAGLDELPPVEAIREFLRISWQLVERWVVLLQPMLAQIVEAKKAEQPNRGIDDLIERIVRRGLASGEFATSLPAGWLVSTIHSLGHLAAEQAITDRLGYPQAAALLETSVLQLCGVDRGGSDPDRE